MNVLVIADAVSADAALMMQLGCDGGMPDQCFGNT